MLSKLKEKLARIGRQETGFTLIELMIVIAVIGTLAGIAIPKFGGVRDKAEIASVKSTLRSIKSGLVMYNAENGEYPDDITDIEEYVEVEGDYTIDDDSDSDSDYKVTKDVDGTTVTLTSGGISVSSND
ncbi:type IV pilin protein [Halanaerobaculum tunisiense]